MVIIVMIIKSSGHVYYPAFPDFFVKYNYAFEQLMSRGFDLVNNII